MQIIFSITIDATHGDVYEIPWFHFKYGTIFLSRFEKRTQNQQQIHYIMTITHVSHMKQVHVFICVHMCSLSVFQERATTRHTHFIVFIRFCGYDCSRAFESSRSRFLAYFIFSFLFFIFMVSSTILFIV